MKVQFSSHTEKADVLGGLRVLHRRFWEGDKDVANGIRISVLEQAIVCVEATPVNPDP